MNDVYDFSDLSRYVHRIECSCCGCLDEWSAPSAAVMGLFFVYVEHQMMTHCLPSEHKLTATVYDTETDTIIHEF